MRAIVVTEVGGPEAMSPVTMPDPVPGPSDVVVDVAASGVNFIDVYHRSGRYPMPVPFTPGQEGAGVVRAVGSEVDTVTVGDRVAWAQVPGSYATAVAAPASSLLPVPEGVELETAAAVMLQGLTAHYLCRSTYRVEEGDVVVVHAAAGGVGLLLTRMIALHGGVVVATVSSPEKAAVVRRAGAAVVAGYDDYGPMVAEFSHGRGAAAVFDGVGAATFEHSLAALRPRGTLALFGQSSGAVPPVDPQALSRAGSVYLTRPTLAHHIADRAEFEGRAADLFGWIATGEIDVHIGGRYPLDDAARAHEDLASRRTTGKLVLV